MDKFRATATARQLCDVVSEVLHLQNFSPDKQPLSDGGEGFRDVFRGEEVNVHVSGPLGETITAGITFVSQSTGRTAIIESAQAIGRDQLIAPTPEQALAASSAGVAELLLAAVEHGAQKILLGLGGSASSDGGWGCYEILRDSGGLRVPVVVATDVIARFSGARRYASQKGVRDEDLVFVDERLARARAIYQSERDIDVESLERSGAAGGIAGALAALGAELVDGLTVVEEAVGLRTRMARSNLVISGEGRLDEGSLEGKVTGGLAAMTSGLVPLLLICGSVDPRAAAEFTSRYEHARIVALSDRVGLERATQDVFGALRDVVNQELTTVNAPRRSRSTP